ncbi:hypothetical protein VNO77_27762 [Canavalia gladiata]|uniref:Uncharacterized protein n=1 Tax=Canavalia gladiata TaxID=3824 RepID=A0AAN9KZG5_CANGL
MAKRQRFEDLQGGDGSGSAIGQLDDANVQSPNKLPRPKLPITKIHSKLNPTAKQQSSSATKLGPIPAEQPAQRSPPPSSPNA